MAEGQATQFAFTHRQLITQLIRAAEVHEGYWALSVQFGIGVGSLPQAPGGEINPGVVAVVQSIGIQRHEGEQPAGSVIVDAGEVNPP